MARIRAQVDATASCDRESPMWVGVQRSANDCHKGHQPPVRMKMPPRECAMQQIGSVSSGPPKPTSAVTLADPSIFPPQATVTPDG
jgi:hypothetical protein